MTAKSNRRRFLLKAVQSVIPFSIRPDRALADNEASADKNMVKFLTADGDLIEIDQQMVDQLTQKLSEKTSNKEILNWTNQVKTKDHPNE